jgi:hypothetical protein
MARHEIIYGEVKREVFDNLVNILNDETHEPKWKTCVGLHYNGSAICGNLKINVTPGEKKIYLDVVDITAKLIAEYYW